MADLLKSLVPPKYEVTHQNHSQDSFYSVEETTAETNPTAPRTHQQSLQEQIPPSKALQTDNGPLQNSYQSYDINSYLSSSSNAAHLNSAIPQAQTGHHVSLLYQVCQTKGLTPVFEVEGEADRAIFTGVLKVGDITVTLSEGCRSKKEARERLAGKAIELVKAINVRDTHDFKSSLEEEIGRDQNWVGMLQEYHNQISPHQPPLYTFHHPALQSHACTLTLPSLPTLTFGSPTVPFPTKKLAHRTAAKQAITHLISTGALNPDGSTRKAGRGVGRNPNLPSPPSSTSTSAAAADDAGTTSNSGGGGLLHRLLTLHPPPSPNSTTTSDPNARKFTISHQPSAPATQLIAELAPLLNLPTPQYHFSPDSPHAPNLLSGYVSFAGAGGGGELERVGEVRNVFGKKAAREEAAKKAWGALVEVVGRRGGRVVVKGQG